MGHRCHGSLLVANGTARTGRARRTRQWRGSAASSYEVTPPARPRAPRCRRASRQIPRQGSQRRRSVFESDPRDDTTTIITVIFHAASTLPARRPVSRFRPSVRAVPVRRDRRLPFEPEAPGIRRGITRSSLATGQGSAPAPRRHCPSRPCRCRSGRARARASSPAAPGPWPDPGHGRQLCANGGAPAVDNFTSPHEHTARDAHRTHTPGSRTNASHT